jgi:hypothetical protein
MSETEIETPQTEQEMSDEQALYKIAQAMKDNAPSQDEKQNVFTFLFNIATAKDTTKVGNLRDDKDLNELGIPEMNVRGAKELALISEKIMGNDFFKNYFLEEAEITLATSLSRNGFLVRSAVTQVKQVADATRRRKINKGGFGKEKIETSGGDINSPEVF